MPRVQLSLMTIDPSGNAVSGATVTVTNRKDDSPVTVYTTEGGTTPASPFQSDAYGRAIGWVNGPLRVKCRVDHANFPTYYDYPDLSPAEGAAYPGDLRATARRTAPDGWLVCDGSAVSRTTYAALFAEIDTDYGVGDGVNTFNLPDFRGRAPFGADSGAGRITANNTRGASGGSQSHAHTGTTPDHLHGAGTLYAADHAHGAGSLAANAPGNRGNGMALNGGLEAGAYLNHSHSVGGATAGSGTVGVGGSTGAADRSLAFTVTTVNGLPPYQCVTWLIKT